MINQETFSKLKEELKDKDPLMHKVRLKDIQFDKDAVKNNLIIIDGSRVPVNQKFWNSLGTAVNLQQGLINKMAKNADIDIQASLLHAVKEYSQTRESNKEFLLVGNAQNREVTGIIKADKYNRLSNETLFNTAETVMNEIPNLHVESIDRFGGDLAINLIHTSEVGFERLGPDEVFRFGISLVNTNAHSRIDDFFYRLSCENGAVTRNLNTAFEFGTGSDTFRKLLEQMNGWSTNSFVPKTFQEKLEAAMSTKASYAEIEKAMWAVSSSIGEKDEDRKAQLQKAIEATFFPEYHEAGKRIFKAGYNPMTLTEAQKKFIKTDASVWDVVNELTWIGSHHTQYDLKNPNRFKKEGGALFTKEYDLRNASMINI